MCQCSYISRLTYVASHELIEKMMKYNLDISPDAFNAALSAKGACADTAPSVLGKIRFVSNRENLRAMVARRRAKHSKFNDAEWVVVAFKGTNTLLDVIQDARVTTSRVHDSLPDVHTGFAAMLRPSVRDIIDAVSESLRGASSECKILVTGHSLGGSLADAFSRIAALHLPERKVTCVTFGQPRTWAGIAPRQKNHTYYRIENRGDPIPSLPFWLEHQPAAGLNPPPNVRSQYILARFENAPRLPSYLKNAAHLNANSAAACAYGGGRAQRDASSKMKCNVRASAGLCHSVYMDVGYLNVMRFHRYRAPR